MRPYIEDYLTKSDSTSAAGFRIGLSFSCLYRPDEYGTNTTAFLRIPNRITRRAHVLIRKLSRFKSLNHVPASTRKIY